MISILSRLNSITIHKFGSQICFLSASSSFITSVVVVDLPSPQYHLYSDVTFEKQWQPTFILINITRSIRITGNENINIVQDIRLRLYLISTGCLTKWGFVSWAHFEEVKSKSGRKQTDILDIITKLNIHIKQVRNPFLQSINSAENTIQ